MQETAYCQGWVQFPRLKIHAIWEDIRQLSMTRFEHSAYSSFVWWVWSLLPKPDADLFRMLVNQFADVLIRMCVQCNGMTWSDGCILSVFEPLSGHVIRTWRHMTLLSASVLVSLSVAIDRHVSSAASVPFALGAYISCGISFLKRSSCHSPASAPPAISSLSVILSFSPHSIDPVHSSQSPFYWF